MTGGQTDRQTDESDFIGRCPTNVERPISAKNNLLRISSCLIMEGKTSSGMYVSVIIHRKMFLKSRTRFMRFRLN